MMAKNQRIKSALEIIEEAVYILRHHSVSILPIYFIGSLPFVMAFLYFWTDMSQSAFANEHIITASLFLALIFIWMKCWHAVFCRKITSFIHLQTPPRWSFKEILHIISSQSFFAGSWIIILPLAMVIAIPFGWVYAFYQNISVIDNGHHSIKEIIKRSWNSANLWPGQNHIILAIISIFSIFVFLNAAITIYTLPIILKKFLGFDTVFTLSGTSVLNTTFLAVSLGFTYLVVDPLLKTVYTLRCFYVFSVKSGSDLRTDMLGLKRIRNGLVCILFFSIFSVSITNAIALEKSYTLDKSSSTEIIPSDELDHAIERTLKQREFAWRMPKEKLERKKENQGILERFFFWATDHIKLYASYIKDWWNKIGDWLKRLLPNTDHKVHHNDLWRNNVYFVLYFLLAMLLCILAVIIWRQFQGRKRPATKIRGQAIPSVPDITNDYVNPVELPADRWLNMGYDLMKGQSLRLALRAFYLSILARLAEKNMITIARHKTNTDYITELRRRAHEYRELINLFSINVQVFDESWYGMHEVTGSVLEDFINDQKKIVGIVHG